MFLGAAVRALLDDPMAEAGVEPADEAEAAAAVRLLDAGLREGPAAMRAAILRTQETADSLSADRLQIFAELIQNADDAGAREIRFTARPGELLVAHDGRPVRLGDILLLALPGLSGKTADPDATGRFGIGLATVRALSRVWEVHCAPYRVRFDGIGIGVAPPLAEGGPAAPGWTVFRIPLDGSGPGEQQVADWFSAWDDSSLLFLRSLRTVRVAGADGREARVLRLAWTSPGSRVPMQVGPTEARVRIRRAETGTGAAWRVFDAELPCPEGILRRHKAAGARVPVAVALPVADAEGTGMIHAGLPLAPIAVPVRVHAQFDPLVDRRDFASGAWNDAMAALVADLWAVAVPAVLGGDGPTAWHLVPGEPAVATDAVPLAERLRAQLVDRARRGVAAGLRLACSDGIRRPLDELAVEDARLTGVLTPAQIAGPTGAAEVFPAASRDKAGRWRRVLADWRAAGQAALPAEVTVADALRLFADPEFGVEQGIRLATVALRAGLDTELPDLAWVAAADGTRHVPPARTDGTVFVRRPPGRARSLAHRLGMARDLHPLHYADTAAARTVLAWLVDRECVLDADEASVLLKRLAAAVAAGEPPVHGVAADRRLRALREALGRLPEAERRELGPRVGPTVSLRARDGADAAVAAAAGPPGELYLPADLDPAERHPFAAAALDTPGLRWLDPAYRDVLGPGGDGALERTAFLRALGVSTAPRLVRPHATGKAYATDRYPGPALPADATCGTPARTRELRRLGADHTLDDRDSPDLATVAAAIAAEPDAVVRRRRAAALVHTIGRVCGRRTLTVDAAYGYYGWHRKGRTAPLWIWRLRDLAWLDRADGTPARPGELHLPTAASRALYGREDPGYLHPDLHRDTAGATAVLLALGLTGDPDVEVLAARLRELRGRTPPGRPIPDALTGDVLAVYRALAALLGPDPGDKERGDPRHPDTDRALRAAFPQREALVLTDGGWRRPGEVLGGPSILGAYRAFVLAEHGLRPLWDALGIREPDARDLTDVLAEAAGDTARPTAYRMGVTLDALRRLARLLDEPGGGTFTSHSGAAGLAPGALPEDVRAKLAVLPLRTRGRWTTRRPVYAIDNRHLAESLGTLTPVWQPGGDLQQFAPLLGAGPEAPSALRVTLLEPRDAAVLDPGRAAADPGLTESYRRALARLQDTLVRDEPEAAAACADWARLAGLDVRVLPGLRIALPLDGGHTVELEPEAQVAWDEGILYVASPAALETTRGAGQAVAACFARERTLVGHVWRDIRENEPAAPGAPLPSALQRDREAARRIERLVRARTTDAELGRGAAPAPGGSDAGPAPAFPPGSPTTGEGPATTHTTLLPPQPRRPELGMRHLVDVTALPEPTTILPAGEPRPEAALDATRPTVPPARAGVTGADGGLPLPAVAGAPPRQHTAATAYTPQDRETAAWHLLRIALAKDGIELFDHRGQNGLGADAVDSRDHFYEIKAHAGPEPREVALTVAEFERAIVAGDRFSLVIASNLEEGAGIPRLRVITDPLRHLNVERSQLIRLTGLPETTHIAVTHEWPPQPS